MRRIATWMLYGVGALAIAYLALYAYVMMTRPTITPGEPIRIFRNPDGPDYSAIRGHGRVQAACMAVGTAPCAFAHPTKFHL